MMTDPITYALTLLPPTARTIVGFIISLIALASMIVATLPPSVQNAKWAKVLRFISGLTHAEEPGTLKIPFTNIVLRVAASSATAPKGNSGFASVRPLVTSAVLFVMAVSPVLVHGCSGSTTTIGVNGGGGVTPGGNVNWTVGVSIGITVARPVIIAAKAALDASPAISVAGRTTMDQGFQIALDSLPLAQTALDTFAHQPTNANLCMVRFNIEQALTGALQSLTIARDAGANSPALYAVQGALGGLAAAADMLGGACDTSSAPPAARRTSAQERLQAVLAVH